MDSTVGVLVNRDQLAIGLTLARFDVLYPMKDFKAKDKSDSTL